MSLTSKTSINYRDITMPQIINALIAAALLTTPALIPSAAIASPSEPATLSQAEPIPSRADQTAVALIVQSVATLADQGDFAALETLFADAVHVDYTSLFGGTAQTQTPAGLMTAWASVLPGFDQTYHAISNIAVDIEGTRATATANVFTDHYLGDRHWQVSGQYRYQLERAPAGWQITAMRFTLREETGDRALLEAAEAQASAMPTGYLQRQQTEQAVRTFLTSLETKDMAAFASVWAEDAVQDMPFAPEGFPKRVEGRENLIQHYAAWPEISGAASFTDALVVYPMGDPTMVFAEWRGSVDIISTGRIYNQRYGGLFHVVNGKIVLFREYFDPIVFSEAFGLER